MQFLCMENSRYNSKRSVVSVFALVAIIISVVMGQVQSTVSVIDIVDQGALNGIRSEDECLVSGGR